MFWKSWLGRQDSNLGMSVPKTDALPLGDAPTAAVISEGHAGPQGGFGGKNRKLQKLVGLRACRALPDTGAMEQVDVIVLGAGAAGLMAAIEVAKRGRRVLVVDHAKAAGEKIRISGGGRCNFTNLNIGVERFLGANPRFALSALKRFTQWDFIARMDSAGIAWHEKTLGQLFCDGSARDVVAMLLDDLAAAGGVLRLNCAVQGVVQAGAGYEVQLSSGPVRAASVIVATGGKSIPKMGASGLGYQIAAQFGLGVTQTRPALVPLTFGPQDLDWIAPMAGLALPVRVRCGAAQFDEAMLLTHRGLSGPAILQISSYWHEGQAIVVDLVPQLTAKDAVLQDLERSKTQSGRAGLARALGQLLPARLAQHFETQFGQGKPLAEIPRAELVRLATLLQSWELRPLGSEGYRTAEVTLGGVDTEYLDARTLQSKAHKGLFFIGEVVDVTGWLGGYNFQWAWSSGWAAGQVA
jgi:predicted Rossmann fold flavoprotein